MQWWKGQPGRLAKLDQNGLSKFKRLMAAGRGQAEYVNLLGVSACAVGRIVANMNSTSEGESLQKAPP